MDEEKPMKVFRGKYGVFWNDPILLKKVVDESESLSMILLTLGVPANAGNYSTLKSASLVHGLELPKFDSRGCTKIANLTITLSDEEMFSNRGVRTSSGALIKRLLKNHDMVYECTECKNDGMWQGEKLVLELDHIDGNSFNNEISNLRLLCGNCHSQTSNFRGKNIQFKNYQYCLDCSKRINRHSERCDEHSRAKVIEEMHDKTVLKYGSLEDLYKLYIESNTFTALGIHYNVSCNSIRKYIKKFGISVDDFRNGKLDLTIQE